MAIEDTLSAARNLLLDGARSTVAGAVLDQPDTEVSVVAMDDSYLNAQTDAISKVEYELATHLSVSSAELYVDPTKIADMVWLTADPITSHPDPMPRENALPLAVAYASVDPGSYPTIAAALTVIYANYTFS